MEEKCKESTVSLYEEVGKSDQLGESGCPERLRVWLKKTKENALLYEKTGRQYYRSQVVRLNDMLSHSGASSSSSDSKTGGSDHGSGSPSDVAFLSFTYKSFHRLNTSWKDMKKTYTKKYTLYNNIRTHHDQMLRPELGSVNHQQELNTLHEQEQSRTVDVEELIKRTRYDMLLLCESHVKEYNQELHDFTLKILFIMDDLITEKDLRIIPDEVDIKLKRKSLKSLRKKRMVQEMKLQRGDSNENTTAAESSFRGHKKVWDGIPSNKLSLLGVNVVLGKKKITTTKTENGDGGENGNENGEEKQEDTAFDANIFPTENMVLLMNLSVCKKWIEEMFGKKSKGKKIADVRKELIQLLPR
jgi:hypothetical protein